MTELDKLEPYITKYVDKGFRVVFRDGTSAQLVRPKRFSLLLGLIALPVVILYYLASRDDHVYLSHEGEGISEVKQSGEPNWAITVVAGLLIVAELWAILALVVGATG